MLNLLRFSPFLIALGFLAAPVFAQSKDVFDLSIEELLAIPIAGSTINEQARANVPSAVTVFSRTEIDRLGATSLADLANYVPGFQVLRSADSSGYSLISSRGRRISSRSAEILLLIDGKRARDVRVSGLVTLLDFPLFSAERVEFIRGPGAALYGSGAMMGVINVITRSDVREIESSVGENNNVQLHLGAYIDEKWGLLDAMASIRRSSGQHFTVADSFTGAPVNAEDAHELSDATLKYTKGNWSASARFAQQIYEGFYALEVVDKDVSRFKQEYSDIAITRKSQKGNFNHSSQFHINRSHNQTNARFTPPGVYANISEPQSNEPVLGSSHFHAQELELSHVTQIQTDKAGTLTLGASYSEQEITKDKLFTNFSSNEDGTQTSSTHVDILTENYNLEKDNFSGIFAQWQLTTKNAGEFTLGLRHDYYFEIDKQHLSPRLAWVYPLSRGQSIKILYGEAFRAPNLHERGIVDNDFIRSNPDLKPETVSTSEVIWFGSSHLFIWSLGYFYNSFTDPILQEVVAGSLSSGTRQYVNSDHSDIEGLEAEVQFDYGNFLFAANATKILKTDDIAYRESTELFSFWMNYNIGRWNYNISAAYRGDRGTSINQQDSLGSYWLSAAKIRFKASDKLDLMLRLSNLTDDEVHYPAQGQIANKGIPSRGRELSIGARWQF